MKINLIRFILVKGERMKIKSVKYVSVVLIAVILMLVVSFFSMPVPELHWMGFMSSEDAQEYKEQAQELGTFIYIKTPEPGIYMPEGYLSVFVEKEALTEFWSGHDS